MWRTAQSAVLLAALLWADGCRGPEVKETASAKETTGRGAPSTSASAPASDGKVDPACTKSGCLRAVVHVGDYDRRVIAAVVPAGIGIDNGYSIYTIRFATDGREALATVAVPFNAAVPAGGWHIVLDNHGTTGIDDPCKITDTLAGAGLAGLFGARSMVGVAGDYPGLGTDGIHPYLVGNVHGRAALDALRATRALLASLHIAASGRYAVVGMSQGGYATLAAAARHHAYAPELDIRAFAVAAPASAWEEHWRLGASHDGAHLAVHAMLVYAWAYHYGYSGPSLWAPSVGATIDDIMKTLCAISPVANPITLFTRLGTRGADIFSPEFLAAYRSGSWGSFAVFGKAFAENRLGPYPQTAPLHVYQGDADDIVPEAATRQVVQALRDGGNQVEYEVVPGGHHADVAFGFVASRELRTAESVAWIRSKLE